MNEAELLDRLHRLLVASHAPLGAEVDRITPETADPDMEVYPCGSTGVIAFVGDYVLCGWEDNDLHAASAEAFRRLHQRLQERRYTLHMVQPRNFRSVKLTRKLGAVPIGVDEDGYVHYRLTLEGFEAKTGAKRPPSNLRYTNYGQEVETSKGP